MDPAARDAHVAARIAEWQSVDLRVGHGRCGDVVAEMKRGGVPTKSTKGHE